MELPKYVRWENIQDTKSLGEEEGEEPYKHSQDLLEKYFNQAFNEPNTLLSIYHRVTLLNGFYSTRMGAELCFKVAEYMQEIDLDNKIMSMGSLDLIKCFTEEFREKKMLLKYIILL